MRTFFIIVAFVVVTGVAILGFRGGTTTRPPIEVFPDMDRQSRYEPQGESDFFPDGRANRPAIDGAVARGELREEDHLYRGGEEGDFATGFPGIVSREMMKRGQERFAIYCAPCHGDTGDGNGITREYGMMTVPTFHSERIREMPEGEVFDVITHGKGLMGSYAGQIPVEDRWNIISYLRALQRSQQATVQDVPADNLSDLGL